MALLQKRKATELSGGATMNKKFLWLLMIVGALIVFGGGCVAYSKTQKDANFSHVKEVAKLSTIKARYHLVAHHKNDGKKGVAKLFRVGYKEIMWEYEGTANFGIDARDVVVHEPTRNNVIVIEIPKAKVLSYDVIEESISKPITDKGWFTKIDNKFQKAASEESFNKMKNTAKSDKILLQMTQDRADKLISDFVINAGKLVGKTYEVKIERVN